MGVLNGDKVIDLAQAYTHFQREAGSAASLSGDTFPPDLPALLRQNGLPLVEAMLAWVNEISPEQAASFGLPLADLQVAPLLRNPSKIICIGLNYHDHCREQNVPVPEKPIIFVKFPSAIIGPEAQISWDPDSSQQVDYEAELAVVIKKQTKQVSETEALDYIAGYTIVNDISARDAQFSDGQWIRGKSFDTFCPIGPYLVTPDEIADPHNLAIRCRLNGERMQDSNTAEMIFKLPQLIAYISKTCTLEPGDVLSTGTPDGVGVFRQPKVFLKSGDVVEVEIEQVGRLRNTVA